MKYFEPSLVVWFFEVNVEENLCQKSFEKRFEPLTLCVQQQQKSHSWLE